MQSQPHLQYSLFRIPQVEAETNKKKKIVVGLIDASGSMGSYWGAMVKFWNQTIAETAEFLITFSHIAKLQQNTVLSQNLNKHGGGMTNIYAAFEKLQQRLMKVPQDASITIIFISDGQDTTNGDIKLRQKMKTLKGGQGRDITMLCLGIQSGFPTKMSMDIRQLYHTGDQKIPALYLIQYASQKAFFNKFQSMASCFTVSNEVDCLKGKECLKEYPWENDGLHQLKQGQWVMIRNTIQQLELIYNKIILKQFPILTLSSLCLDDIVDCFRGWVQKVQLLSMDNAKMNQTSKIAHSTANIMRNYTYMYQKCHNLYILTEKPLGLKQSFKERASTLIVKNVGSRVKWFIDQLQIISKGVGIGQLNEYEAAKRIGIGTITGKYHQKALALKGITVKDFEKIKQEFASTFQKTKLSQKPSSQEVSIFTLQNQKQVFQEADFLEGLKLCGNQYDLVQSFPVVGYSLKIKRYDGSMINPWKVRVLQLAKTHNSIDSVYLANNSNKYELSVGEGKVEEINAILPLFTEDDIEMSQLFNTKLFKLAVSFMVVQNIDTYHEEAYLALLASTFVYLINEPESEWRNNLIKLIYSSLKVTYWQNQQFKDFIMSSLSNPKLLFTSKQKQDHTDITKVMLLVFFIGKQHLLPAEKLHHFIDLVMVHYVEKTYVENQFKLSRVANVQFKLEGEEFLKQGAEKVKEAKQNAKFSILKNYDDLKKIADKEISELANNEKIDIDFDPKIFLHNDEQRRVTYEHIKNYYNLSKKKTLPNINFIYYFGHALKGKDEQVYREEVSRDIQSVKKEVFKKIDIKALGPNQGKKVRQMRKIIEDRYVDIFQKAHFGIVPIKPEQLQQLCQQKNINYKDLHINEYSGMVSNACMSPHCKYFLQPLKHLEFLEHMRLWKKTLPNCFHMRVMSLLKLKLGVKDIYEKLIKQNVVNLERHRKSKEQVLDYIQIISQSLKK